MTYFSYSEKANTGREIWYSFKELLKTAGWTVNASSTGSVYNSTGDSILSVTDINNNGWITLVHPLIDGYQRAVCIQWASTSNYANVRIKIGWAGFNSGSPSATRVPTFTDEQILIGTGTDASPTFASFFGTIQGDNNIYAMAGNAAEKYSFHMLSYKNNIGSQPTASMNTVFIFHYLNNTNVLDIDPYVYVASGSADFNAQNLNSFPWCGNVVTAPSAWYKKGLSGASFVRYNIVVNGSDNSGVNVINKIGSNPYDNKIDLFPLIFARSNGLGAPVNIKGNASNILISMTARSGLSTLSINSNQDKLSMGSFLWLPHNGTNPRV